MTLTTTATITFPEYLAAPKPTSIGDLLRATIDSGLVAGAQLTVLLLLIARGTFTSRGGLSAREDYMDLWAQVRTTQQELDEALTGLQRQFGGRFFLLRREGDDIYLDFTPQYIWDAARKENGRLVTFDLPDWEE